MAKRVKCPRCKTPQDLGDYCVSCHMDFNAYIRELKRKKAAAQANAPQGAKVVKCPKCGKKQPLEKFCSGCGINFQMYMQQMKRQKTQAEQVMDTSRTGGESFSYDNFTSAQDAAAYAALPDDETVQQPGESTPPLEGSGGNLSEIGALFSATWEDYKKVALRLIGLNLMTIVYFLVPFGVLSIIALLVSLGLPDYRGMLVGGGMGLGILIGMVTVFIPYAGLMAATCDKDLGFRDALREGAGKLWGYLWLITVVAYVILGGMMLFFIPLFLFGTWFFAAQFILFDEDVRGMDAMLKSKAYVKGRFIDVFVRLLIIFCIMIAVGLVPFGSLIFMPFMVLYMYRVYSELREINGINIEYRRSAGVKAGWLALASSGYLLPILLIALLAGSAMFSIMKGGLQMPNMPFGGGASISLNKTGYAPGEAISVQFTAPDSYPSDAWIGIIPSHVQHGSESINDRNDIDYRYLRNQTSGVLEFSAPYAPGTYDLRMNDSDSGGSEVASVTFTVEGASAPAPSMPSPAAGAAGASLRMDKYDFNPGETVSVHFTAPSNFASNAWVGIIPSHIQHGSESVNDQHDIAYKYLESKTSGSLTFNAPSAPGSYDFRMHDTDSSGSEVASVSFTVGGGVPARGGISASTASMGGGFGMSFTLENNPLEAGRAPRVIFSEPLNAKSGERYWITITGATEPDSAWGQWQYVDNGATEVRLAAPASAGTYEIRLHDGYPRLQYNVVYRMTLLVVPAGSQGSGNSSGNSFTAAGASDSRPASSSVGSRLGGMISAIKQTAKSTADTASSRNNGGDMKEKFSSAAFKSESEVLSMFGPPAGKLDAPGESRSYWYYQVDVTTVFGETAHEELQFLNGEVNSVQFKPPGMIAQQIEEAKLYGGIKNPPGKQNKKMTFAEAHDKVIGKSKSAVLSTIGEPDDRHLHDGREVWQYDSLVMDSGKTWKFAVIFVNDKVDNVQGM